MTMDIPRDEYGRPRVFLEEKCPVAALGIECQRESGVGLHPPVNRLHVWWARRPLTVSRAAVLGSLLPASYDEKDFLALMGVPKGKDPIAAKKLIDAVRSGAIKERVKDPYGYKRAFTHNPTEREQNLLKQAFSKLWGTSEPTILDSFAGGGSIPFEAVRVGCPVILNELNPVASIIEKATIEYPSRFGMELKDDILRIGKKIEQEIDRKIGHCFPRNPGEKGLCYIWTRTVTCPNCELTVPLSPNYWLDKKGSLGYRLIVPPEHTGNNTCWFEMKTQSEDFDPNEGTVKRGVGACPRCPATLDGDYIKKEAQEGRMGHQLAAVGFKREGERGRFFRAPTPEDLEGVRLAEDMLKERLPGWEARGLAPTETRYIGPADRSANYGVIRWVDCFSSRQLLIHLTTLETILNYSWEDIEDKKRREALRVYMQFAFDKGADYNSIQTRLHSSRGVMVNTFDRHDFAFKWSYGEIDGAGQLFRFGYEQEADAYKGLCGLIQKNKIKNRFVQGDAAALQVPSSSLSLVIIDPPYYDNVMYAELSDFFYVWMKRGLGDVFPELFSVELTDKDSEAVANVARFKGSGRGMGRKLAYQDYEAKMTAAFAECHRVLKDDGVFTVMFTHKKVEAWDTLARSILDSGFEITATWPIHTESQHSLHQAKKNAAASTILLICRKRPADVQSAWWEDIKDELDNHVREKAQEFKDKGLRGQDTFIACFGPALQHLSSNWPVRAKDGGVVSPQDALDRARNVVGEWFIEHITEGKATDMDRETRFYILSWFIYGAREVKFDEINRLAISMGIDLDRLKQYRLVEKKGDYIRFPKPEERFRKRALKADAEDYRWDVDYVHSAIHEYETGKSINLERFHTRTGALKREGYLDAVAYLLDTLPRTDEVTEFHTLAEMARARGYPKEKKLLERVERTRQEYATKQPTLFDDYEKKT